MGVFLEYLLDIIFLAAMVRVVYSALRRLLAPRRAGEPRESSAAWAERGRVGGEMARDPECGMFVSTEVSRRLPWKGQVLHFCSQECLERYQRRSQAS